MTPFSPRFNRMSIADQKKKKTKLRHSTNKIAFVCVYVCMCILWGGAVQYAHSCDSVCFLVCLRVCLYGHGNVDNIICWTPVGSEPQILVFFNEPVIVITVVILWIFLMWWEKFLNIFSPYRNSPNSFILTFHRTVWSFCATRLASRANSKKEFKRR